MVNKRYKGHGGSAGYPKWWNNAGGNVNKGWGTPKGGRGGGGGKPPSGCGKKIVDSSLLLLAASAGSVLTLVNALNHIFM